MDVRWIKRCFESHLGLTSNCKPYEEDYPNEPRGDVKIELSMIVGSNTIMDPRAVAMHVRQASPIMLISTYWSCFATHRRHRIQCLVRKGLRSKQVVQKFSLSNFHILKSSSTTSN